MPWELIRHQDAGIIETRYIGMMPISEVSDAMHGTIEFGLKNSALFYLGDLSRLEGGHSMADLYAKARYLETLDLPAGICEALVLPESPDIRIFVEFWQTICQRFGFNFHTVNSRDEGIAWLLQQKQVDQASVLDH